MSHLSRSNRTYNVLTRSKNHALQQGYTAMPAVHHARWSCGLTGTAWSSRPGQSIMHSEKQERNPPTHLRYIRSSNGGNTDWADAASGKIGGSSRRNLFDLSMAADQDTIHTQQGGDGCLGWARSFRVLGF